MDSKHQCTKRTRETSWSLSRWIRQHTLILGIISLCWLVFKSGQKPSRLQYPCQKTAAANVSIFLIPFLYPLFKKINNFFTKLSAKQAIIFFLLTSFTLSIAYSANFLWNHYSKIKDNKYYNELKSKAPFGVKLSGSAAGTAILFQTTPHAMALPSPHRVVSVHNTEATSWDFSCTADGACPSYYGDDVFVDQDVVDQMFEMGLKNLTNASTIMAAWQTLIPSYQNGEKVAVKVNFNDSIAGGGASGYDDNDAYVDALPQVVNSIISGLKSIGVQEEDIRIFDSSRYVTNRFRSFIDYPDVKYFDRYGNGSDVLPSTFSSTSPSAQIDFSPSGYPASSSSHKVADLLADSKYLINVPIMKKHGGAGITLALKNHLGSINGFVTGSHTMHRYFYLSGRNYSSSNNPIVDINLNTNIKDKTVLIVGDALYGGWRSNNTPPERWQSFGDDSPDMLFFSVDPVAVDSVMFDYINREGYVDPASEDILIVAANAGLGVHERWNNDLDREYSAIDYLEADLDTIQEPATPTGLSASAVSTSIIDLSWQASTSQDSTILGYRIYRDNQLVGSSANTSFLDTGLSANTLYSYQVSSYDNNSMESQRSAPVTSRTKPNTQTGSTSLVSHVLSLLLDD